MWAKVSAALEESRKVYLLYWRGVLGQCLDQEAKALADLKAFAGARGDRSEWAGLTKDAQRRIRQIERRLAGSSTSVGPSGPGAPPGTGGVVSGIVLSLGGGGLGGLAAWQWVTAETKRAELYQGAHIEGGNVDEFLAAEAQAALLHRVFTIGGAATGATGLALLIAGGAVNGQAKRVAAAPWLQSDGASGVAGVVVVGEW